MHKKYVNNPHKNFFPLKKNEMTRPHAQPPCGTSPLNIERTCSLIENKNPGVGEYFYDTI